MDEYKSLKKLQEKNKDENYKIKNELIWFINRCLISIILFVITLMLVKNNNEFKDTLYKKVYSSNLSFLEIEKICKKYLGDILPKENKKQEGTQNVDNEKLAYNDIEEIEGGVKVKINKGTNITSFESGIVLFAGNKDDLGQTLIIEQVDGVEAWYVNIDYNDIKIYDYIEKDKIIGTSISNEISLYFKKKGEVIDYKKYIF